MSVITHSYINIVILVVANTHQVVRHLLVVLLLYHTHTQVAADVLVVLGHHALPLHPVAHLNNADTRQPHFDDGVEVTRREHVFVVTGELEQLLELLQVALALIVLRILLDVTRHLRLDGVVVVEQNLGQSTDALLRLDVVLDAIICGVLTGKVALLVRLGLTRKKLEFEFIIRTV